MNDPVQLDHLTALDALRRASRDEAIANEPPPAADWFAADDAGARLPITLDVAPRHVAGDLDALGADILAPLAR